MNRPIYALTKDEAYERVSAENKDTIFQEIENKFAGYTTDSPSTTDELTCYKIHNTSSHAEVYELCLRKGVIVKLVKQVKTEPVLVKNETMTYDRLDKKGVIAVDVLGLITDKVNHIEYLYQYHEKTVEGRI